MNIEPYIVRAFSLEVMLRLEYETTKQTNFKRKAFSEQGQQTWKGRGTRKAHPRKAMNKKCLFFQWNLQVFTCNECSQLGIFWVAWGVEKDVFSRFYVHATFKIMLANEGGKQICKKNKKKYETHVCRVLQARRRRQIAHEI